MQTSHIRPSSNDTMRRARRGLAIYFAIVVALSAPIEALTIWADLDGGANGAGAWVLLMTEASFQRCYG